MFPQVINVKVEAMHYRLDGSCSGLLWKRWLLPATTALAARGELRHKSRLHLTERFELRKNRPLLKIVHYATNYTACVLKCKSKLVESGGFVH